MERKILTPIIMMVFLGALAGCPEKRLTPDPVPVDEPQVAPVEEPQASVSKVTYDDLMGYEGRLAPHAGPNRYFPLYLLA